MIRLFIGKQKYTLNCERADPCIFSGILTPSFCSGGLNFRANATCIRTRAGFTYCDLRILLKKDTFRVYMAIEIATPTVFFEPLCIQMINIRIKTLIENLISKDECEWGNFTVNSGFCGFRQILPFYIFPRLTLVNQMNPLISREVSLKTVSHVHLLVEPQDRPPLRFELRLLKILLFRTPYCKPFEQG